MARQRYALTPEEWPRPDRDAWHASLVAGDLLEPGGLAAGWAATTRAGVSTAFGRWVAWLASRAPLDPERSALTHATKEVMGEYVAHLRGRCASGSVVYFVSNLVMAARAIAPGEDWSWLKRIVARLKRTSRPTRDKRARLQTTDELFGFGVELMEASERVPEIITWRLATDYRDGLMIALLALRPFRRANFCSTESERHLIRRNDGYAMQYAGTETKHKHVRLIDKIFPAALLGALDRYLTHYRPWLCRQTSHRDPRYPFRPSGNHLWVSKTGSAFSEEGFYKALRKRTEARFGRSLHPHLFRDCAATTIAMSDPRHVLITMSVLDHTTMETSERHYNHAQGVEAIGMIQDHILTLRRRAKARRRGRRGVRRATEG